MRLRMERKIVSTEKGTIKSMVLTFHNVATMSFAMLVAM